MHMPAFLINAHATCGNLKVGTPGSCTVTEILQPTNPVTLKKTGVLDWAKMLVNDHSTYACLWCKISANDNISEVIVHTEN